MNAKQPYQGSRMPTLGKLIVQPMADEPSRALTFRQKLDRWMINEGFPDFGLVKLTDRGPTNVP